MDLSGGLDEHALTHNAQRKCKPQWHRDGPQSLDEVLQWPDRCWSSLQEYSQMHGAADFVGNLRRVGMPTDSSACLILTETWAGMASACSATQRIFKGVDQEIDL